jgi:hypothetical protein
MRHAPVVRDYIEPRPGSKACGGRHLGSTLGTMEVDYGAAGRAQGGRDLKMHRRGSRCRVVTWLLVGSLALSAAPAALAQAAAPKTAPAGAKPADPGKPDLAAAKRHYSQGDKLFKAGDFGGALTEFQAANGIKPTPQVERFIGQCEDNLGHLHAALDWYAKFLDHVPEKMATQGDELRKRSAEIKAMPGKVHVESTPSGASVAVDDKPAPSPTPTDLDVPPGSHVLKLTAPGRVATIRTIDVAFASSQTVTADLAVEPPPPPPPPVAVAVAPALAPAPAPEPAAPTEPRSKLPAFITGGLAIAAAGVGTVFGVMALNDQSNFNKNPTTQTADNGDTHALISDMAFGVAITFGVTSAVLFLTRDDAAAPAAASNTPAASKPAARESSGVEFAATPIVGPHTGGAGFVVRF